MPNFKNVQELISYLLERTLLGLCLNDATEVITLLEKFPAKLIRKGETLFLEGASPKNIFILLSGEATLLSSKTTGKPINLGTLSEGRAANLYAVVRGLPFQYSAVASSDCMVCTIPWSYLKGAVARTRYLHEYLLSVTESPFIRALSKNLDAIGVSKAFKIQFLGNLRSTTINSQAWILHQHNIPSFCFAIVEGSANAYQEDQFGKQKTLWEVPRLTWQFWNECIDKKESSYSYRSLTPLIIYKIEKDFLDQLRTFAPKDFQKYDNWVKRADRGKSDESDDAESSEKAQSASALFPPLPNQAKLTKKYPIVHQYNEMDSGPACLASISKYFGNEIPIQYWRDSVSTALDGTSMFDMAKAAEQNGFVCHGLSVENLNSLERALLPCVVLKEYHYIVLYEVHAKYVVIGDPALGIRRLSREEFMKGFDPAILALKPSDAFYGIKIPTKGNQQYLSLLRGYGREAALILGCSAVLAVMSLFPPILAQITLDEVLAKKDLNLLFSALGIGIVVALSSGITSWVRTYYLAYVTSKFDFLVHSAFMRKLFSLPYSFFTSKHVGDFTRRLSEMERLRTFFTSTVVNILIDIVTLLIYGIVLANYSPTVTIMCFTMGPILIGISALFSRKLISTYSAAFQSRAEQDSLLTDLIKGAATIKTLGAEVASRWRFEERLAKTLKSSYSFNLIASALHSISDTYYQITRFLLIGAAAYLGIQGKLSPGQVVALSILVGCAIEPFRRLANAWSGIQEIRSILDRMNDVFLAPSEIAPSSKKVPSSQEKFRGEIEFQEVWFRYGGEASDWALREVNFKILPGQNVAIVGPSGSGKSTILNLLGRIYEPTRGRILIDGRDIREYDLHWLRSQVGLLHQESNLFYGSISENIAYGNPKYDMTSVIKAAKMADADQFIAKKSNDYDYILSHGGAGLSGGEKQRIALARAIFANPSILILDEATSALDGISERKLLESIRANFQGKTVLSIAHRHTTVQMTDFALVISDGRIVGFGTHEELARENTTYENLFGLSRRLAA